MKKIVGLCVTYLIIKAVVCVYTEADCKSKEAFAAKAGQLTDWIAKSKLTFDMLKGQFPASVQGTLKKMQKDMSEFKTNKEKLVKEVQSGKTSLPDGCKKAMAMINKLQNDMQALNGARKSVYTETDCKTKEAFAAKAGQLNDVIAKCKAFLDMLKGAVPAGAQGALTKMQKDLANFKTSKVKLANEVQSGKTSLSDGCKQAMAMYDKLITDMNTLSGAMKG
ncbi:unnamed protein product [Medioppia subpectinata]|uniref:Uncharacterized protein n=1 Tax=Medioppia subpectinata TaxID=1979941 RepID=A0A7R9L110_9ACAR|nr:unnamed protein product [Medioppia subpectinata]CAG2113256.1 unnamed protein product [Medioppia subpectinata]